jgi:apolipoprotein D and lipocalin family protein
MGRWYVLGYTPILVDKKAHNAIEHYRLDEENKIQTTYQFRDGGFDGELKTYTPVGWVHDKSTNAQWRMQFIWPFRSDYIILHLAEDYSRTIVAHPSRKYAWIMQREPQISDQDYETMLQILESEGVDRGLLLRLPQDWSTEVGRMESLRSAGL